MQSLYDAVAKWWLSLTEEARKKLADLHQVPYGTCMKGTDVIRIWRAEMLR